MDKVLLLINSKSGVARNKDSVLELALPAVEARGERLDVEYTHSPGDAGRYARQAADEGYATVIVAGGDGTVNDAASGLWDTDVNLGVVPLGSGNGLARSLGIPQELEKAVAVAVEGNTKVIDRGMANGRPFYCAFGAGIDAEIGYRFSLDRRRGKMTYVKHALREIFTYSPRKFKITGEELRIETEAMLVAVCNCNQYGSNAYIAPSADAADGLLDITIVHSGNFLAKAVAGLDLMSGALDKNILVEMFRVDAAHLEMEPGIAHVDGEPVKVEEGVELVCQPRGLRVCVPRRREEFRPYISPIKSMWEDIFNDIKKVGGAGL